MKTKRIRLPLLVIFRDRTLELEGVGILKAGFVYVAKGRTLTLSGIDPGFRFEMSPRSVIEGSVRVAKKPQEMTVDQLREKLSETNNEKTS